MESVAKITGVVEEGGRVTLTDLPYEAGQRVDVWVEPRAADLPKQRDAVEVLREMGQWIKARYPNAPLLSDAEVSRDSIYEDDHL